MYNIFPQKNKSAWKNRAEKFWTETDIKYILKQSVFVILWENPDKSMKKLSDQQVMMWKFRVLL